MNSRMEVYDPTRKQSSDPWMEVHDPTCFRVERPMRTQEAVCFAGVLGHGDSGGR